MNILGISCFYHDSAAALVSDGKIIAAAQEERFTRKKHDPGFPVNAVKYCLAEGGINVSELNYVVFYDKPFLTFERLLMTYLETAPRGLRSFLKAMTVWLSRNLHVKKEIKREIGYEGVVLYTEHHESHAASAFYPSPFESAAILTVDGVGEWATASYGTGVGKDINLLAELHFPDSVGLLYSAFTYFTGFKINSGEYKLMGLAPYGEPVYKDLILRNLVDVKPDGSMRLNLDYFDFPGGLTMTNARFDALFGGPPRKPESPITKREMDIAASIQAVTEEIISKMAVHVHRETGQKNLCMAGGVALNCVANGKILKNGPFEKIWIQPAAGDAGGALGAALSVWHRYLGKDRPGPFGRDRQQASRLGPSFGAGRIEEFLSLNKYPYVALSPENRARAIAEKIAEGKIVGHFCGRMEFGPRALGGRSILGDPRSPDTQRVMNLKIKYRESFRPFAPSVMAERTGDYFDLSCESPYMLLVARVKDELCIPCSGGPSENMLERVNEKRSSIPAVTHLDYSARVQSVNADDSPEYHAVLKAFEDITGCAVLVNTSFNVRGEPIVCTPEDAYRCFMRTEMDVLVLENAMLFKEDQPEWAEKGDWRNEFSPD
ncbi:MAG: carbamoyltransferase [Deltaproteobacteria bacterium]|nr:carbamoyltransferase [Deltaproteobacteria bacterium]